MKSYKGGDYPRTTGYCNRQTPVEGDWWIKFVDQKADMMYEDDRTPEIYPARGQLLTEHLPGKLDLEKLGFPGSRSYWW